MPANLHEPAGSGAATNRMTQGDRRAVIAGIGRTPFSRASGRTPLGMAAEACRNALKDAGLDAQAVDGFGCFTVNDTPRPMEVAYAIGSDNCRLNLELAGGGHNSPLLVSHVMLAVEAGVCEAALLYRSLNGRSGKRFGSVDATPEVAGPLQFGAPHGYLVPPQWFALWARRHMVRYGTTEEDFGAVALTYRSHAVANPQALQRAPLSMDEYLAGRWICEPFRVYDCALEADGAVALLLTTAERARDLRQPAIRPLASEAFAGSGGYNDAWPDMSDMYSAVAGPRLWAKSGIKPANVDVACLYDCFSYTGLCTTEDYGFCEKGEGGLFYREGRATYGGDVVVNPHGGLLSEGYIHGFNHHYEAVLQLRGQAGVRQVENAEIALVSGGGPAYGSVILYARAP
jgi:acetyl-CoA acetyltransferase